MRPCILILLCAPALFSAEDPMFPAGDYGFVRIFEEAKKQSDWADAKTLSARIYLVRKCALKRATATDPVPDRYMITCYGGPVDLVHFLCLAAHVCSGQFTLEAAVYRQWVGEGGPKNLNGYNAKEPPAATPDDLPSNALGALFGQELRAKEKDPTFDLQAAFAAFVAPLLPVPDKVAKEFSHSAIVMGLPAKPTIQQYRQRYAWFTAAPLLNCGALNKVAREKLGEVVCEEPKSPDAALKLAGFQLQKYKGQPIVIRRIPPR